MRMRLTPECVFDAAPRILGHPGKCAYLHGHAYRFEVTVSAEHLDATSALTRSRV